MRFESVLHSRTGVIEGWSSNGHRIPAPRTFRDFYAFEQHVLRCRAKRGLSMDPAWYERPAFYFSNPVALVGHETPVFAPFGSEELDYELELGVIIGRGGRDIP